MATVYLRLLALIWLTTNSFAADAVAPALRDRDKSLGTLHLIGGDVYRGEMVTALNDATGKSDGSLVWSCPSFASNLVVPWNLVERLSQPFASSLGSSGDETSTKLDEFIFQLNSGESITGKLTNMSDQIVEVSSSLAGKVQLPFDSIQSILRSIPTTTMRGGTLPLDNWKQIVPAIKAGGRSKWFEQTGSYDTETAGTSISQSVVVPDLAAIDIEVAWEQPSPNWMITLGEPRRMELHFRKMETRKMVSISILVDDELSADVATAQLPSDGLSSISLRILCDSNRGRFVLLQGGRPIAQLRLTKSMRLTGRHSLTFTNIASGRISVREIKVYPSVFTVPFVKSKTPNGVSTEDDLATETLLRSGETFLGRPSQFDVATQTFGFAESKTDLGRVKLEEVDRIEFPYIQNAALPIDSPPMYMADLNSGARYVGQSIRQELGDVVLELARVGATVRIPIGDIHFIGLNVTGSSKPLEESTIGGESLMKLVSPWAISTGRIDKVAKLSGANSDLIHDNGPKMFWKPKIANSVALADEVSGIIEPILEVTAAPNAVKVSPYVVTRTGQKKLEPDYGRPLKPDEPSLFLKNGDCFPATSVVVNETHTLFKSDLFESGKIANDSVRGIRVLAYNGADSIEKGARKRLLTLPRAQRVNPPTHLIVSRQGDALRGHLKGMTEDVATIEVRGSERAVLMKTVAEVIWLPDPPEIVPPAKPGEIKPGEIKPGEIKQRAVTSEGVAEDSTLSPNVAQPDGGLGELQCQALFGAGTRVSLVPERIVGSLLYGKHPQLGTCQIDISKMSRLVLGNAIAMEAQRNWFGKWKLENALDPKFVNDLDAPEDGGSDRKMDSGHAKMIGESAPDFELKKLDGGALRLAELQGKIVVLDFWATWCGPCIASLPKLNEIAQEYKGVGVELVAVNIEQKPAEIQALLTRLEINPTVVLDSDGSIARAYHAQAIPQTVIIDRKGNVVNVIVGGGDSSEKKVRDALNAILDL